MCIQIGEARLKEVLEPRGEVNLVARSTKELTSTCQYVCMYIYVYMPTNMYICMYVLAPCEENNVVAESIENS
jgi:hypothetical protein